MKINPKGGSDLNDAIVPVDENLVGMWYIAHLPGADYLVGLRKEGDQYEFRSRFKYYNSPKPFDPKDRRNVITGRTKPGCTREEAIEKIRGVVKVLSDMSGQPYDEILVENGDLEKFMQTVALRDWAHTPVGKGNA